MEEFWLKFEKSREKDNEGEYEKRITIWQYVATESGVIRIWPGIQLPKVHDLIT